MKKKKKRTRKEKKFPYGTTPFYPLTNRLTGLQSRFTPSISSCRSLPQPPPDFCVRGPHSTIASLPSLSSSLRFPFLTPSRAANDLMYTTTALDGGLARYIQPNLFFSSSSSSSSLFYFFILQMKSIVSCWKEKRKKGRPRKNKRGTHHGLHSV